MRDRKRFLAAMMSVMVAASACSGITAFASEAAAVDVVTVEGGQVQGVESDTEGVKGFRMQQILQEKTAGKRLRQ